jgi:hypothetical protein
MKCCIAILAFVLAAILLLKLRAHRRRKAINIGVSNAEVPMAARPRVKERHRLGMRWIVTPQGLRAEWFVISSDRSANQRD